MRLWWDMKRLQQEHKTGKILLCALIEGKWIVEYNFIFDVSQRIILLQQNYSLKLTRD